MQLGEDVQPVQPGAGGPREQLARGIGDRIGQRRGEADDDAPRAPRAAGRARAPGRRSRRGSRRSPRGPSPSWSSVSTSSAPSSRQPVGPPRDRGHVRAGQLGQLDREPPDAAAGAGDQHALADDEAAQLQRAQRRQTGHRQRRGLLEGDRVREAPPGAPPRRRPAPPRLRSERCRPREPRPRGHRRRRRPAPLLRRNPSRSPFRAPSSPVAGSRRGSGSAPGRRRRPDRASAAGRGHRPARQTEGGDGRRAHASGTIRNTRRHATATHHPLRRAGRRDGRVSAAPPRPRSRSTGCPA